MFVCNFFVSYPIGLRLILKIFFYINERVPHTFRKIHPSLFKSWVNVFFLVTFSPQELFWCKPLIQTFSSLFYWYFSAHFWFMFFALNLTLKAKRPVYSFRPRVVSQSGGTKQFNVCIWIKKYLSAKWNIKSLNVFYSEINCIYAASIL